MKKYIGKKEVKAEPCTLGEFIAKSGRNPYQNDGKMHGNDEPGYLVEYEDGYRSWSPKEVFVKAYKASETPLDRMHIEYRELFERFDKLTEFIESGKADKVVKDRYSNFLLRLQREIMSKYITTLECRIGCMDGAPNAPFNHMPFGVAIEALKQGLAIRRKGWNGKGLCVFKQVPSSVHGDIIIKMQSVPEDAKGIILGSNGAIHYTHQCIIYDMNTGIANSWVPSVSDMFAADWELADLPESLVNR